MGFLIIVCNLHLCRHWKKRQSWKGFVFAMLDEVSFLNHQFLVAELFHQLAHVLSNFFIDSHFHLCGAFASYLSVGYPCYFHAQGHGARPVDEH